MATRFRSSGSRRFGAWAVLALACTLPLPRSGSAQPAPRSTRWLVAESATLDLWYHGLATIGYDGVGPLPFHAPGYAADMRRAKAALGIAPTPLERDADALRAAFRGDSAFELLHFLPLYFADLDPPSFLGIVHAVAAGTPTGPLPPPQRAGVAAIRQVLGGAAARTALARLARDLDVEWGTFYEPWLARSSAARGGAIAGLQRRWDAAFASSLGSALAPAVPGSVVYLVPALGPEGRVVPGTAGSPAVVAVWWPPEDAASDAPLFAAVRELCFTVVERLPIDAVADGDRARAAGESARAAVRCGARLLEARAPALAAGYRETFRRAALRSGAAPRGFTESYRLAPATERALDAELQRLLAAATGAPR